MNTKERANQYPHDEYNELYNLLSEEFKKNKTRPQRIQLTYWIVIALVKSKSVNYRDIVSGIELDTQSDSLYRRVQRFFEKYDLCEERIAHIIHRLLPKDEKLTLVIDRSNWKHGDKNINVFMLGVAYKNVAIPLFLDLLDKRGNSNTEERIALINKFINLFGKNRIDCLLADREFLGEKWFEYLATEKIEFHIRIRKNIDIYSSKTQKTAKASRYFDDLKIGESKYYKTTFKYKNVKCYMSGMKVKGKEGKPELIIILSLDKPNEALDRYGDRWQIETLFRAFKTSGFNLEKTHVVDKRRVKKLVLLCMLALVWCYKVGDYIDNNIKKIEIKSHNRRAISVFKYGLNYLIDCLRSGRNVFDLSIFKFLSCT